MLLWFYNHYYFDFSSMKLFEFFLIFLRRVNDVAVSSELDYFRLEIVDCAHTHTKLLGENEYL